MLINFIISNWMSFRDSTVLSMEGTDVKQHSERLPRIDKFQLSVLPVSLIIGGNASGKSNLVKALQFAQNLIVERTNPREHINLSPFLLGDENLETNTKFEFEILIDNSIYEYSFSVNKFGVVEEKLEIINRVRKTKVFHRTNDKYKFNLKKIHKNKVDFFEYVGNNTSEDKLFISNSIIQNDRIFIPICNWFNNILMIVTPNSVYPNLGYFFEGQPNFTSLNRTIPKLDFGISSFQYEVVKFENLPFPEMAKSQINKDIKEGEAGMINDSSGNLFKIKRENGKIVAEKMFAYHSTPDGRNVRFDIQQESNGTRRIIDLIPALHSLENQDKVLVIDEIDRGIHPILIRQIIESYLEKCNPSFRTQLIFTTHNVELLDQQLFRPDEFWVTNKNTDGSTVLRSLCEFKGFRDVKDFRESYLKGRFGGIPHIQNGEIFDFSRQQLIE